MKIIQLTQGYQAIVDDEDFDRLSKYSWSVFKPERGNSVYAIRGTFRGYERHSIRMHREVLNLKKNDRTVDHIDGDGLNNQKSNLRICTQLNNSRNRTKTKKKTSSIFKGVSWSKSAKKWHAYIKDCPDKKQRTIGFYINEKEAADAYDREAEKSFGIFSKKNTVIK